MLNKRPKLIVISAPSGSGKTSVIKEILHLNSDKLTFSVSATTRKRRPDETNGVDYYFLSEEQFKRKIDENGFVEWENIYGDLYGTTKNEVERLLKQEKAVLFDLDVNGSLALKKLYPEAVLIFIMPPSIDTLIERLKNRNTETPESLSKRIEQAKIWMEKAKYFDYEVKNYDLATAISEVNKIIQKLI